jgi:hypothetical protein
MVVDGGDHYTRSARQLVSGSRQKSVMVTFRTNGRSSIGSGRPQKLWVVASVGSGRGTMPVEAPRHNRGIPHVRAERPGYAPAMADGENAVQSLSRLTPGEARESLPHQAYDFRPRPPVGGFLSGVDEATTGRAVVEYQLTPTGHAHLTGSSPTPVAPPRPTPRDRRPGFVRSTVRPWNSSAPELTRTPDTPVSRLAHIGGSPPPTLFQAIAQPNDRGNP